MANIVEVVIQGTDRLSSPLGAIKEKLGGLGGAFADVSKIAGGFLVGGIIQKLGGDLSGAMEQGISSVRELAAGTARLTRETGLTATQASGLISIFNRFGLDAGDASKSLGIFAKGLNSAEVAADQHGKAAKGSAAVLRELGVTALDAHKNIRPMNDILLDVADKFKSMPDGAQKTAIAMQLFGRSGKDLLPILNQGKQGMQELQANAEKYGLTLTGDNLKAVKEYGIAHKNLDQAMQGMRLQIGVALIPIMTVLAQVTTSLAQAFNQYAMPALRAFGAFIASEVLPRIKEVIGWIGGQFAAVLRDLSGPLASARDAVLTFGQALMGKWTDAANIEPIHRAVGEFAVFLRDQVPPIVAAVERAFTVAWPIIKQTVADFTTFLQNVVGPQVRELFGWIMATGLPQLSAAFRSGMADDQQSLQGMLAYLNGTFGVGVKGQFADISGTTLPANNAAFFAWATGVGQRLTSAHESVLNFGTDIHNWFVTTIPAALREGQTAWTSFGATAGAALVTLAATVAVYVGRIVSVVQGIGSVFSSVAGAVSGAIGSIVGAINGALGAIGRLGDAIRNIPVPHLPHIPGFASGVTNFAGGLAMVGERGPELMYLPRGTSIMPNTQTERLLSAVLPDRVAPIVGVLNVYPAHGMDERALADLVVQRIDARSRMKR